MFRWALFVLAVLGLPTLGRCQAVYVTDFGAACDGITDDTAAIQDALNSGNSDVYLPLTTSSSSTIQCNIPEGITLVSGVTLHSNNSYLGYNGSGKAIQISGLGNNGRIADLFLDMTGASSSAIGVYVNGTGLNINSIDIEYGDLNYTAIEVDGGGWGLLSNAYVDGTIRVLAGSNPTLNNIYVGPNPNGVMDKDFDIQSYGTAAVFIQDTAADFNICGFCLAGLSAGLGYDLIGATVGGSHGTGVQIGAGIPYVNGTIDFSGFTGPTQVSGFTNGLLTYGGVTYVGKYQIVSSNARPIQKNR